MTHPDDSPPEGGRKARTRRALFEAAGELFTAQGIEATTVDEIASTAGVSVGALYMHFENKEALALAYIGDALGVLEAAMEDAWKAESAVERVLGAGDAYLRFAIERPVVCRFANVRSMQREHSLPSNTGALALQKRVQRILLGVAGDLKQAMGDGEIETVPIDETLLFLWGAWNGVCIQMVREDSLRMPPDLTERALAQGRRILLAGLRPAAAAA